jgi:hypothetical protein
MTIVHDGQIEKEGPEAEALGSLAVTARKAQLEGTSRDGTPEYSPRCS